MSEPDAPHPRPAPGAVVWYRSFYWRIAIGFVVTVAVVLALQAALFLWLASRTSALAIRAPEHVAAVAAAELGTALEADPALDVDAWLAREYGRGPHRVIVVRRDDRVHRSGPFEVPPFMLRAARVRQRLPYGPGRAGPRAERNAGLPARADGPLRERSQARRPFFRPVVAGDEMVAVVAVVPAPPGRHPVVDAFGPTLVAAAIGLLAAGTALMAFVVFRPVHRRLRRLETAAAALGGGDTAARAPEDGGDEVASLARRFNRMAADLDAHVRRLREADRSRRQLLADVSHELMTPLTAMRGYLETLALPAAVQDEVARARYLAIVTAETRRLEAIIGDLLDLARLEGGGGAIEQEPVAIDALFARALERHEGALTEGGVTLARAVAADAGTVVGDNRRLEQVIQNLVANAVRHTPPGGRITLRATRDDGAIAIAVDDTGPGIPAEHLPHVFDRFYRVDAARDGRRGGSGLGLSIVRAVVERHGGRVSAGNGESGGARFEVRLPVSGLAQVTRPADLEVSGSGTPA